MITYNNINADASDIHEQSNNKYNIRTVTTLVTLMGRAEWMISSKLKRANRNAALMLFDF